MAHKAHRVLAYFGTANLGDAIQTAAMSRLLAGTGGSLLGVYRDRVSRIPDDPTKCPFVINGWLDDPAPPDAQLSAAWSVILLALNISSPSITLMKDRTRPFRLVIRNCPALQP